MIQFMPANHSITILLSPPPSEEAGDLCREYVLRIPSVSLKATKGAPLHSHGR